MAKKQRNIPCTEYHSSGKCCLKKKERSKAGWYDATQGEVEESDEFAYAFRSSGIIPLSSTFCTSKGLKVTTTIIGTSEPKFPVCQVSKSNYSFFPPNFMHSDIKHADEFCLSLKLWTVLMIIVTSCISN